MSLTASKYYIQANLTKNVIGPSIMTTSINIKNYVDDKYMDENLIYKISINNAKFELANNAQERTLAGGASNTDTVSLGFAVKSGAVLSDVESITLVVDIISPYTDQKTFTITYDAQPPANYTPTILPLLGRFHIVNATTDNITSPENIKYYYSLDNGATYTAMSSTDNICNLADNTTYSIKIKAVDEMDNERIVTASATTDAPISSGLILDLDATRSTSFTGSTWKDLSGSGNNFTLYNSPVIAGGAVTFNGTQYARSTSALNFSTYNSVTVEIILKVTGTPIEAAVFESSANWNTSSGGFGLFANTNGGVVTNNMFHTHHNTESPRNYIVSTTSEWMSHTNIYSRIADLEGRLTYVNGNLVGFTNDYINYTANGLTQTGAGAFYNGYFYIAARGGSSSFFKGEIVSLRIYNRKLTPAEITSNYNKDKALLDTL
jgi:hypothetical protein